MERPASMIFNAPILSKCDTLENVSHLKYKMEHAEVENLLINEGRIIRQYFSHFLFFIEIIEFQLSSKLNASYVISNPNLFLFLMLDGKVDFSTSKGIKHAKGLKGFCFASYNKPDEYFYELSEGRHIMFFICPKISWISKNMDQYPRLIPFLDDMENAPSLYGHMSTCQISTSMKVSLTTLLSLSEEFKSDLEVLQLQEVNKLITEYHHLVDAKLANRNYRIKDFLDTHYMNPDLTNHDLVSNFHITEKTLIENFKQEFGITPYNYLIKIRMIHAKILLKYGKRRVAEVYTMVGYKDVHSFSVQYKKFYGFPPSRPIRDRF